MAPTRKWNAILLLTNCILCINTFTNIIRFPESRTSRAFYMMLRFFKLNRNDRHLFVEAAYETLLVRIVTTFCNTRRYVSWLGYSRVETEQTTLETPQREQVLQVKTAIARCRYLVWARKCLVESIAAKRMLNRRHIPSTLYMGVAKDEKGKMIAHAWLRSGDIWVSGGRNRHRYTIVGIFS